MSNFDDNEQQGYFPDSSSYRSGEPTHGASSFQTPRQEGNPFVHQGAAVPTGVMSGETSASGFFSSLFDFSFNTFITPKVVKLVYLISAGVIGLVWLLFLLGAFSKSVAAGFIVLIIGPFIALLYLVFVRLTLEFYLAVVRMSEDIHNRLR